MGGTTEVMKRIPRIKFPQRHPPKSSSSASGSTLQSQAAPAIESSRKTSDVPASPRNTAVGGKASLQPKRTPVSDREIEAILLGGCF